MTTSNEQPKIHAAMAAILAEVGAVGKAARNTQQNYNYRAIDDVVDHVHSLFAAHKVYLLPKVESAEVIERKSCKGNSLIYTVASVSYRCVADDGSEVTIGPMRGEGMDSGDKSSNKAMAAALKYALCQAFLIPYNEMGDSEVDSPELAESFNLGASVAALKRTAAVKMATAGVSGQQAMGRVFAKVVSLALDGRDAIANEADFQAVNDMILSGEIDWTTGEAVPATVGK